MEWKEIEKDGLPPVGQWCAWWDFFGATEPCVAFIAVDDQMAWWESYTHWMELPPIEKPALAKEFFQYIEKRIVIMEWKEIEKDGLPPVGQWCAWWNYCDSSDPHVAFIAGNKPRSWWDDYTHWVEVPPPPPNPPDRP